MATSSSTQKGIIKLPVQTLNWKLVKKTKDLKKIIFQFDVKLSGNGSKVFAIIAYPAYRYKGKWKFGKRIALPVKEGVPEHELRLPITLGNLELKYSKIKKWICSVDSKLTFTPHFYKQNPHVSYKVTDGVNSTDLLANPCPPAKPAEADA
jgi:hypothetical protein